MAEQSYHHHTRLDPKFHFTLMPLLWVILLSTIALWRHHHTFSRGIAICMAAALLWIAFLARVYALKAQDRIIRLEETLRLQQLGGSASGLSIRQFVALRFASDAEVVALAQRAAREQLATKQIKEAIQTWRPDYDRI